MKKNKAKSLEDAIKGKFPKATIYEVRNTLCGKLVLGVVPALGEDDTDHVVEWRENGCARECHVDDRDYLEVGWDAEQEKPVYMEAKLLIHNEVFDVLTDGSTTMS